MTDSKGGAAGGAAGHAKIDFESRNTNAPEKKPLIKSSLESSKLREDSSIHCIQPGSIRAGNTASLRSDLTQNNNSASHKGTKIT